MHRGWKRVVGGLRHIYVIVGMNGLFATQDAARYFDGAIRDYLIGVHVRLRAAASLPNVEWEMVIELAGHHFIGCLDDQASFFGREFSEILVYERGGFLEYAKRVDQFWRHGVAADIEVNYGASGLCAVVTIGGDFNFPHAVRFSPHLRVRRR